MIRYRLLIFGLFFLFNPYLWIMDLLPDFIGFLLIAKAIKPLIDASPSAESASSYFKKAAAVSVAQIALLIPMVSFVNSDPTFNMVFSFTFSLLRLMFILPAIHELFNSFYYFADKYAQPKLLMKTMKTVMGLYFIVHAFLSSFPEIVYFKIDDSGFAEETVYPLSYYRTGIMFLCSCAALIIGIIWFVFCTVAFLKLRKNMVLNQGIANDVANADRPLKKTIMRSFKPAKLCLTLSAFLLTAYFVDGKPVIPPYVVPALHIAAITFMRRISEKKVTRAFSIAATVVGVLSYISYEMFTSVCHDRALFAFEDVKLQFYLPLSLNLLYTALLVPSLICLGVAFYRIISKHTGLYWENAFITHNSKTAKTKLRQKQQCVILTVLSCAAAIASSYSYYRLYIDPKLNLTVSAICIALACLFSYVITNVKMAVLEKYSTNNVKN